MTFGVQQIEAFYPMPMCLFFPFKEEVLVEGKGWESFLEYFTKTSHFSSLILRDLSLFPPKKKMVTPRFFQHTAWVSSEDIDSTRDAGSRYSLSVRFAMVWSGNCYARENKHFEHVWIVEMGEENPIGLEFTKLLLNFCWRKSHFLNETVEWCSRDLFHSGRWEVTKPAPAERWSITKNYQIYSGGGVVVPLVVALVMILRHQLLELSILLCKLYHYTHFCLRWSEVKCEFRPSLWTICLCKNAAPNHLTQGYGIRCNDWEWSAISGDGG